MQQQLETITVLAAEPQPLWSLANFLIFADHIKKNKKQGRKSYGSAAISVSVPSNKDLFEKARTQYEGKPIGEMW